MGKILVTGMPGCGKEEFVKIAGNMGYDVVRMGDVVREWARDMGLGADDKSIGGFADSERKKNHYGIWAERTLERLSKNDTVIDGVRGDREVGVFREELGDDLVVVAVHASPCIRYARLVKRGRDDAPGRKEEFLDRDERELGWGLGSVISNADVVIVNQGTLEEFREDVEKFFSEL